MRHIVKYPENSRPYDRFVRAIVNQDYSLAKQTCRENIIGISILLTNQWTAYLGGIPEIKKYSSAYYFHKALKANDLNTAQQWIITHPKNIVWFLREYFINVIENVLSPDAKDKRIPAGQFPEIEQIVDELSRGIQVDDATKRNELIMQKLTR